MVCAGDWGAAGKWVWAAWAAGTARESGLDPIKLQFNPEKEVWDLPAPPASLPAPDGALSGGREAPGQSFKGPFRGNSALINDWRQDRGRLLAPRLPGQHEGSASRAPLSKVRAAAPPAPPPCPTRPLPERLAGNACHQPSNCADTSPEVRPVSRRATHAAAHPNSDH